MIDSDSFITKHLPECHRVNDPESIHEWCLCDELRACEERIIAAVVKRVKAMPSMCGTWGEWEELVASITAVKSGG